MIVGAGAYVAGRGTSSYGTILPALNELYKKGLIHSITIAATHSKSIIDLKKKVAQLRSLTNSNIPIEGVPKQGQDSSSYKKALKASTYDCAILVVPDHLHYSIGADLIQSGLPTLIVKPLTPTVQEARKLIQYAKSQNIYTAVEFHKRYDSANLKLKEVISDGRLGDILYINVEYSQRRINPLKTFKNWIAHTNIFQYLGVHYVDIIYFVTGAKPLRVLAMGQKNLLKQHGIDNYDSIEVLIEWQHGKNKFVSTFLTNWIDPNTTSAMSDQKIKVIGTMGRYESDQKNRGVQLVTEQDGIEDINPYFTQSYPSMNEAGKTFKGYGIESVMQFCRDVADIQSGQVKVRDLENKRPTFKDALVSTAVVEAVNKSLKEKSVWVDVTM